MLKGFALLLVLIALNACNAGVSKIVLNENQMRQALNDYNQQAIRLCNRNAKANWGVATDIGNKDKESEKVSFPDWQRPRDMPTPSHE